MKGEFVFMVDGKLVTVHDYREIPKKFQHVIKFLPDIPPPPHSEEQHALIDEWHERLKELINIENQQNGR
jgi:hypothetical protein